MKCNKQDKRCAYSSGFLFNETDKKVVANVDVSYDKIADKLFKKFFNSHFQITKDIGHNPYTEVIEFEDVVMEENSLTAVIPKISNQYCAGHFDGCPAIPIAFSAYNITRYAGDLFYQKSGKKNYVISEANLISSNLPFPDDIINLNISYVGFENSSYRFLCSTKQNDKNVSSLELVIR